MGIALEGLIDSLVEYCSSRRFGLAVWQLPQNEKINFVISFEPKTIVTEVIEDLPPGFLVASFESAVSNERLFLPADISFSNKENIDTLLKKLPDFVYHTTSTKDEWQLKFENEDKGYYESIVQTAINTIKEGDFKKIVLARAKKATGETGSLGQVYQNLITTHKKTFNSLIYTPLYGIWIGASPEILVSQDKDKLFKTVALAGTLQAGDKSEMEAVWSQKELEEQAYVYRYIVDFFKKIRLREFEDIGPRTTRAGNLFHLKTEFLIDLKEVNYPHLLTTLLNLLHPTSAVCGLPREKALEFILKNEHFKRELYSGYIGPVNIDEEIHLYVNLRCAKIQCGVTFYAGAGITEHSVPEKEYLETESKIAGIASLFNL